MNIKDLHKDVKAISTSPLFKSSEGNITAIRILENEQLKEHITKVPALLLCITGEVQFENEQGSKLNLSSGDYVNIDPFIKHWINAISTSNLILIK